MLRRNSTRWALSPVALIWGAFCGGALLLGGLGTGLAQDAPKNPVPPAPLPITVSQFDPTLSSLDLEWQSPLPLSRITVTRDGVPVADLSGSATLYTDDEPGFGSHRYTVRGFEGEIQRVEGKSAIYLRPAPIAAVFCTQLDPTIATVVVDWRNAMDYEEIRVYRDGTLEATLPGSMQTYVSHGIPLGKLQIAIAGLVDGVQSDRVGCKGSLRDAPELGFSLRAVATTGTFDPSTGRGKIRVGITGVEHETNPGFPNKVQGLQLATDYDAEKLTPIAIEPGSGLSSPDFFDGQLLPDGVTVGVVMDFRGGVTLDLSGEKELAVATYETIFEDLVGKRSGVTTEVGFRNGLGTGGPIDNLVVVGGKSVRPHLTGSTVTLLPEGGVPFLRGDLASDGSLSLDDVGFLVATLTAYEEIAPLDDCLDASDVNDDGSINLIDLFALVGYLFEDGMIPAAPFPECGFDPTIDEIPCLRAAACP